jgi:hypothetical protein
MGLERGTLRFVSRIEEQLGRESSGSGLKYKNTAVGIRRGSLCQYDSLADSGHGESTGFGVLGHHQVR